MNLLNKIILNSKGFGHIEAVLAIVVIGAIGAIGARVMFGSHAQTLSSLGNSTSTAWINNTQFVVAYPTPTNDLKVATFTVDSTYKITTVSKLDLNQGVEPGTRPSITRWGNGYIVAWATNSDTLSLYYNNGAGTTKTYNLSYKMYPGTSPSASFYSGLTVAYEASNGNLNIIHGNYATAPKDTGLGMYLGSSPSAAGVGASSSSGYEVAFQSNNGQLWTTGSLETKNWNVSMYPGSSPSIARLGLSSAYEVAYDSTTSTLQTVGGLGNINFTVGSPNAYPVTPGTSPSLVGYDNVSNFISGANNATGAGTAHAQYVFYEEFAKQSPSNFQVYNLWNYDTPYSGSSPSAAVNDTTVFITKSLSLAVNINNTPHFGYYYTSL